MTQANRRFVAILALVVALPLVGHANEGFWPFNRIPRAAIKQALGVDLSDVSVDARGILEALKVVYKADSIVQELVASSASTRR